MSSRLTSKLFSLPLRALFHLLYHQFAWSYDRVAAMVSRGHWTDWGLAVLPYLSGPGVLELGFGPGHLQVELLQRGLDTYGIDASRQMCSRSYRKITNSGFIPAIINGYAQFIPFPNHTFQQVFCTFPSDYIFDALTLAEVARVLAHEGTLLIVLFARNMRNPTPLQDTAWLTDSQQARLLEPFIQAGFTPEIMTITLPSSRVLLIKAIYAPVLD